MPSIQRPTNSPFTTCNNHHLCFFTVSFGIQEKHDVDDVLRNRWFLMVERDVQRLVNAVCLVDGATSLQTACSRHGLDFRYEQCEIGTASNMSFEK